MTPYAAIILVTAIWGVTFVPVKDAVAVYPLFAFLTVRFAVAVLVLAVPGARRVRGLGRGGVEAGAVLGVLLAAAYALQTAGLERTDVSSTGFITGLYVVLTPLFGLLLFRTAVGVAVWLGVVCSVSGLALLAGVHTAGTYGDLLVLASTAAQALQIVFAERYASQYDALALVLVEMVVALACFFLVAVARSELSVPHGRKVWFAILVTGVFASALAYLVQLWAQRRMSAARIALLFALESPFAGLFGYLLDGDRLGVAGWGGCALIMLGIVVAEPAAAGLLSRLARPRTA